jgi:hypothetical protein
MDVQTPMDCQTLQSSHSSEDNEASDKDQSINVKHKFTPDEDQRLTVLVEQYGTNEWGVISQLMQNRNPRQCRERWTNYLQPYLRTTPWTLEEDQLLEEQFILHGTKWTRISKCFIHRSPLSLRNRHMVLARRRRKAAPQETEVVLAITVRRNRAPPERRADLATLFSDEEVKMFCENVFA